VEYGYSLSEYYPFNKETNRELSNFLLENGLHPEDNVDYSVVIKEGERIIATGSSLKNVIKFVAIATSNRNEGLLSAIMTPLMRHIIESGEKHIFIYTSPDKRAMFGEMGFFPVAETRDVLLLENRKGGILQWLSDIKAETAVKFPLDGSVRKVGCIVMNCDPFTRGHRYLIEHASAESDLLHIFILSSGGTFTPEERYSMMKEGISDLHNIALHRASDYIVSPATFPTYFVKSRGLVGQVACELDIKIFTDIIAPALGIKKRFVGTEPYCGVTAEYNRMMSEALPRRGIEFIEIPRFEYEGRAISASEVRRLYQAENWNMLEKLVSPSTLEYLKHRRNAN
jgi:[citrate (pro-3S)-lyase] ligase